MFNHIRIKTIQLMSECNGVDHQVKGCTGKICNHLRPKKGRTSGQNVANVTIIFGTWYQGTTPLSWLSQPRSPDLMLGYESIWHSECRRALGVEWHTQNIDSSDESVKEGFIKRMWGIDVKWVIRAGKMVKDGLKRLRSYEINIVGENKIYE